MNNIQIISKSAIASNAPRKMSVGSLLSTRNFEKGLVIEKSISMDWLYNLYKGTIVDSFWAVLSSPVE